MRATSNPFLAARRVMASRSSQITTSFSPPRGRYSWISSVSAGLSQATRIFTNGLRFGGGADARAAERSFLGDVGGRGAGRAHSNTADWAVQGAARQKMKPR